MSTWSPTTRDRTVFRDVGGNADLRLGHGNHTVVLRTPTYVLVLDPKEAHELARNIHRQAVYAEEIT